MHCRNSISNSGTLCFTNIYLVMFFKKKKKVKIQVISKFHLGDFVDFYYKDRNNKVNYDIDIAGQCPATLCEIEESKVIRIHK